MTNNQTKTMMNRLKNNLREHLLATLLTIVGVAGNFLPVRAEDILSELAGTPGVNSKYLSGRIADKAMKHLDNTDLTDFNLSDGFTSLYSYECYFIDATNRARNILKEYLKKHPELELIIKKIDSFGEYCVYQKYNKAGEVTQMIIWNSRMSDFADVVVIDWKDGRKTK